MLGRAVVAEGRRRGHPVLGPARGQGDVTDRRRVLAVARSFRPELIVNCAAFTRVDECEKRREHAMAVNGEAVAHLAEAAADSGAALVQVSTDYVFDGAADRPYPETAEPAPRSVYGESKLLGEERALAWERGLVVRTSWLFGPGGGNFVATILRLLAEGVDPLRVVVDQVGCPTYTGALARALWELAPLGRSGVLHYRDREATSWHGFAEEIVRLVRPDREVVPISTAEMPRPAPRPAYSVLDVTRTERILGRPVEPWQAGLADYLGRIRRGEG